MKLYKKFLSKSFKLSRKWQYNMRIFNKIFPGIKSKSPFDFEMVHLTASAVM